MLPSATLIEDLDRRFGLSWLSGDDQINVKCPYCQSRGMTEDMSGHLGINVRINKAHCIRCDWGHGNAAAWLSKHGVEVRITVADVDASLDSLKNFMVRADAPYLPTPVQLPPGCQPMQPGQDDDFARSLWAKGLTDRQIGDARLRYCTSGFYDGYVIFPFYEDGEQVYFQGRAAYRDLLDDPKRKKRNPKSASGNGKNSWLYGYQFIRGASISLIEGTLDQISLQDHLSRVRGEGHLAFSLQGTSISFPSHDRHPLNSQWGKIKDLEPEHVYIVFDPDAWGKAKVLAEILNRTGLPTTPVRLLTGDPNEIMARPDGDEVLRAAYEPRSELNDIERILDAAIH